MRLLSESWRDWREERFPRKGGKGPERLHEGKAMAMTTKSEEDDDDDRETPNQEERFLEEEDQEARWFNGSAKEALKASRVRASAGS